MLREAKKMRKELRASLEDARNRVAELESQNLDAKLEIDSLKTSLVVSDDVDCVDFSVHLADLTSLKDKHASACDELVVLRVEVAELKSRPSWVLALLALFCMEKLMRCMLILFFA
jgi:regulator of replication initiation timing